MLPSRLAPILVLPLLVAGCRRGSEISVYRVPKESASAPVATTDPHAGMSRPGSADPHAGIPAGDTMVVPMVEGEVPEHWKAAPGSSMRLASYRAEGEEGAIADISLVVLAGAAGGVLDNVNRWRGQLGLGPVDEAGLASSSGKHDTPVGEAVVVDIEGQPATASDGRIVAAVIPQSAEVWFYKMRGNPVLVGREKEAFVRWVETAKVKVELPEASPPVASPHAAPAPSDVAWTTPAGWQAKPGDSLRVGSFAAGGGTEVTVIRLGGDAGGDLPNVNRWRGQIGLEPLASLEGELTEIRAGGVPMSLVDLEGPDQGTVAAWTLRGGESWFFKLTGPKAAVTTERDAFLAFLESVKFGSR